MLVQQRRQTLAFHVVEVERAGQGEDESLAAGVESEIKSQLGATARVTLLPAGSLPRTEGKTRRVVRTYS